MTLEAATGQRITKRADARAVRADALRAARRAGTFQSPAPAPVTPPPTRVRGELTFRAYADTWLQRAREGRIADVKSERSYVAKPGAIVLADGETLGDRPIGRITEDDLEVATEALRARGLAASSLNSLPAGAALLPALGPP